MALVLLLLCQTFFSLSVAGHVIVLLRVFASSSVGDGGTKANIRLNNLTVANHSDVRIDFSSARSTVIILGLSLFSVKPKDL